MSTWRTLTPHELAGEDKSSLIIGPFGSSLKTSDYRPDGVPLIFVRDIRSGDFRTPRQFVAEEKASELSAHVALPGDVLVTKMGDPPGDSAIYTGSVPAVITADCIRLRPAEDFEPKYIKYAIQAPAIRQQIERITNGVAQRKVSLGRFRTGLSIPVPTLDEQRRIVDLLEDHLSRLDAAASYIQANMRRAENWHAGLVSRALWSAGYPTAAVGSLLREPMRNGRSDRAAQGSEAGTRTLTLTAVTKNAFSDENTKLTITTSDRAAGLWLEPGDVFVQRSNTPQLVGTTARYEGPREWAIFPDLLIRLRVDERQIDSRFLTAALRSEESHSQLRRKAKGLAGSMPKIDQAAIAAAEIPLPELEEQKFVLQSVDRATEALNRLRRELDAARRRSATLRRSLLAAAFSGRLTGSAYNPSVAEEMIGA